MKIENQVCNLDLSKRLKDLGVKQESIFAWVDISNSRPWVMCLKDGHSTNGTKITAGITYSAFTVAELGEMLPGNFWSGKQGDKFQCKRWTDDRDEATQVTDTEADARAKMLIYLIENGLVKP